MMMTLAMMYDVDTHAISSSVAPRFPIMCGMATLTIEVSISSSIAAMVTVAAMMYLWAYRSSRDDEIPDDRSTAVLTGWMCRCARSPTDLAAADDFLRRVWSPRCAPAPAAPLS